MFRALLIGCAIAATCLPSAASCFEDGKATESVGLSIAGRQIERWDTVHGKIQRIRLPSGFELGIQIDPTSPEKYRELLARQVGIDELVKITLFDMRHEKPIRLSATWGGSNSIQGFGPRGGANRVAAMSEQIELWLHKPVCVTRASLPS